MARARREDRRDVSARCGIRQRSHGDPAIAGCVRVPPGRGIRIQRSCGCRAPVPERRPAQRDIRRGQLFACLVTRSWEALQLAAGMRASGWTRRYDPARTVPRSAYPGAGVLATLPAADGIMMILAAQRPRPDRGAWGKPASRSVYWTTSHQMLRGRIRTRNRWRCLEPLRRGDLPGARREGQTRDDPVGNQGHDQKPAGKAALVLRRGHASAVITHLPMAWNDYGGTAFAKIQRSGARACGPRVAASP